MDIKSVGDVRLVVKNKPVLLRLDRTQTFWMVKTTAGWKVDGWDARLTAGDKYRPETRR